MNKLTDMLLNKDSIAETEKIFNGKDYHNFNESEQSFMMAKFMYDNKVRQEHLKSVKDTYFGMNWNEFKSLIKEYGFKEGLSYKFINNKYGSNTENEAILYYHPKGLILWANSYDDDVNGGEVYGQVKISEGNEHDAYMSIDGSHGSTGWYDKETKELKRKGAIDFSMDVREGLFHKLNKIEEVAEFEKVWTSENHSEIPRMYLYDYIEKDREEFTFEDATEDKIQRACEEIRKITGNYKMRRWN